MGKVTKTNTDIRCLNLICSIWVQILSETTVNTLNKLKQISKDIKSIREVLNRTRSIEKYQEFLSERLNAIEVRLGGSGQPVGMPEILPESTSAVQLANGQLHFDYSYGLETRDLKTTAAGKKLLSILNKDQEVQKAHLQAMNELAPFYSAIPADGSPDDVDPFWKNDWFESLDGASLYYFLKARNPEIYMEVGSGNSTKFARKAIKDHNLRTRIISVDPYPRANIDEICDEVIRERCEDVDIERFATLKGDDILFVDNSHRSFQGSDVTVFFTEILPNLQSGVLYGIHDIFLPLDYPHFWKERCYNEQYLLMAFLFGGLDGGTIQFPVHHLADSGLASEILNEDLVPGGGFGGAFWISK